MFGSHGSHFIRLALVAGGVTLTSSASAESQRGQPCVFDEDCAAGAYCADESHCVAPLAVGELCDRHAMCDSGLCQGERCGVMTIESPIDGVATREPKLVVRGQAPAGARLELACGPHADLVVADDAGAWLWVPGVALGDGRHTITARAGLAEVSATIDVDTTRPLLQVFSPVAAQVSADDEIEIRGRVEVGAIFGVRVDGQETFVSLEPNGDWSHRAIFTHGRHRIEALAVDAVGNRSLLDFTFDVDLEAPGVAITSPAEGAIYGRVPALMSGLAEPGAILRIDGHGAGVWLTVGERGAWSWLLPSLDDGTFTFVVTAYDRTGRSASDALTFTIDRTPPGLAMTAPEDGARVATERPLFRGMADEGTNVRVLVDDGPVGSTNVEANGRWSITPDRDLAEGDHVIVIVATDRAGNVTRMESALTVDLTSPTLTLVAVPRIADAPVRIVGHTESRASVEVRLDGLLVASAMADRQGDWAVEFEVPARGEHLVEVLARDLVGYTTVGSLVIADASDDLVGAGGGCASGGLGGSMALLGAALALLVLRRRASRA